MGYSRFYLCDLQVHTAADRNQRYGDVGGREPNIEFAKNLIGAHASAGVEVIAVSDHNRVDWYPTLREAGDDQGVFVFPALEFSVNRCHLLAIWDRTDDGFAFAQRFVQSLWPPGERPFQTNGDPRPVASGQVRDVATRANEHDALVLAPHSTQADIGLLARGVCTNRADVIAAGLIAGYDVWGNASADILSNPRADFGEHTPAWFISGDTRSFDDVGKRVTYLKLGSEPTLEGLRQAFLMPETRIRFPAALQEKYQRASGARFIDDPRPTWPRIEVVSISGGFHDDLVVQFGPGLNAIIGGKGTGKSTLIEILRYVMDAGGALPEGADNRRHNFRANAEATVSFIDASGDAYGVHRTGTTDPPTLSRNGNRLNVEVQRRVSVRVFGQRELQRLADDPKLLREFVAVEAGDEWSAAATSERELLNRLGDLNAELSRVETQVAQLAEDEGALADLTDRVDAANAAGAAELVTRLDSLGRAHDDTAAAVAWPSVVSSATEGLAEVLPPPKVPKIVSAQSSLASVLSTLAESVQKAVTDLEQGVTATTAALEEPAAAWTEQELRERAQIEAKLAEAGVTDARELARIQQEARELAGRVQSLPAKRSRARDLATARAELLLELGESRRAKSRAVESAALALASRVGPRVRVRVDAMADRGDVVKLLEEVVAGQSVRTDQLRHLADQHTPGAIATAIREGASALETLGCTPNTAIKLSAIEPSSTRAIEEMDVPDRIVVEVSLTGDTGDVWADATAVSPGQRAMALLALALCAGTEPLVIDQPEDDLDNRYIYDEVVSVLMQTCQSRQIIVATHNANIPVLGDSEMVLALDAEATHGRILACGGLEEAEVAECARHILEGGEAAFEARHRRYQASGRTRP